MILLAILPIIITLALLRWFEMHMERGQTPFDPLDKITDWRLPLDRGRDRQSRETIGKVTYDPIADAQLKRLQERRRKVVPNSGQRRRRTDR